MSLKGRLARLERRVSRECTAPCACTQNFRVFVPGVTPPLPPARACPRCGVIPPVIKITIPPPRGDDGGGFCLRTDV